MGSKGSSSSSQPNATSAYSGSSPPPDVLAQYQALMAQAGNVAGQPLQQYQGPLVAPFNNTQNTAFNQINNSTGLAQPAIGAGEGLVAASAAPVTGAVPQTTAEFMSPYLNTAVGATAAQQENINQQQEEQLTGQAIGAGAYGGDRAGVAAGELANQQDLANNQVIAGMENTGYNTAAGEAINTLESDASRAGQAGTELGALGNEAQSASLAGANAELGAGTLQQQLSQEQLNIPYEEFVQQQAYPFQTTGWEAGLDEALGSLSGGTSYSTPTPPNPYTTLAGLGLAGVGTAGLLGAFNNSTSNQSTQARGGRITRDLGGRTKYEGGGLVSSTVPIHRDSGGLVPTISSGFVPTANSTSGKGPPNPVANNGQNLTSGISPLKDLGSVASLINAGKKAATKTPATKTPAKPTDDSDTPVGSDDQGNPINADGQPIGGNTNTGGLSYDDTSTLAAQQDYENSLPTDSSESLGGLGGGPDASAVSNAAAGVDMGDLAAASDAVDSASTVGSVMDVMAMRRGGRAPRDLGGSTSDPYGFDSYGYSAPDSSTGSDTGLADAQYLKLLSSIDSDGDRFGGRIHKDDGGSAGDDSIDTGDSTTIDLSDTLPTVDAASPTDITGGDSSTKGSGPPAPQKINAGTTTTSGGGDNTLGDIASVAQIALAFAKRGGRIRRDLGGAVPQVGGVAAPGGMADPRTQMLQRLAMQKSMMPNAMPAGTMAPGMSSQPSIGAFSASPMQTGPGMVSTGGPVTPMTAMTGFAGGGLVPKGIELGDDDYPAPHPWDEEEASDNSLWAAHLNHIAPMRSGDTAIERVAPAGGAKGDMADFDTKPTRPKARNQSDLARGGLVPRGYDDGGDVDDDDDETSLEPGVGLVPVAESGRRQIAQGPGTDVDVKTIDAPASDNNTGVDNPEDWKEPAPDADEKDADDTDSGESSGVSARGRLASPWLALASAGFGMAGSGSPFAGQAIAQGASAGISTLSKQADADAKAQKLHNDAEKAAKQFAAQEKHYSVMQTNAERTAAAAEASAKAKEKIAAAAEANKDADRELRRVQADAAARRAAAAEATAAHGNFTMHEGVGEDPKNPGQMVDGTYTIDSHTGKKTFEPGVSVATGRPGAVEHAANTYMQQWNHDHPDQKITYDQALAQSKASQVHSNEEVQRDRLAQDYARQRVQQLPAKGEQPITFADALAEGRKAHGLTPEGRYVPPTAAPPGRPAAAPPAPTAVPSALAAPTAAPAAAVPERPPVEGARKARDGNWYVVNPKQPDPTKPGHFMRVMPSNG